MIELRDFVAETLKQVIDGVCLAQDHAKAKGAIISEGRVGMPERGYSQTMGTPEREIEFDVAITKIEGTETQGGIGVFVGPVGLGSRGKSDESNSTVSRIKFSVPVSFPAMVEADNRPSF